MTPARQPGADTAALLARLSTAGYPDITVTKLDRWGDSGCVPRPTRHGRGRGQGVSVTWPDGIEPQIIATANLLRLGFSLVRTPAFLFTFGFEIEEPPLRRGLRDFFTMPKELQPLDGYDDDPEDRLDRMDWHVRQTVRQQRPLKKQTVEALRAAGVSHPRTEGQALLESLGHLLLTGSRPSAETLRHLGFIYGQDLTQIPDDDFDTVADGLTQFHAAHLMSLLDQASLADLCGTRDNLIDLFRQAAHTENLPDPIELLAERRGLTIEEQLLIGARVLVLAQLLVFRASIDT